MIKTLIAGIGSIAISLVAGGCGGSGSAGLPYVDKSEAEVAQVLVGAGLTCKDSDTPVNPVDGVTVARWDCVDEGSDHPYFDVFYFSGEAIQDDTIGTVCDYIAVDATNDEVLQLNAINFSMYSNTAVEVNATLSSMDVANTNASIEATLTTVGNELGLQPQSPSDLCS